jgi:hypothetical protein
MNGNGIGQAHLPSGHCQNARVEVCLVLIRKVVWWTPAARGQAANGDRDCCCARHKGMSQGRNASRPAIPPLAGERWRRGGQMRAVLCALCENLCALRGKPSQSESPASSPERISSDTVTKR